MPGVFGAVDGPAEWRCLEVGVGEFEGGVVLEEELDVLGVAVPGGPVEGGGVVLAAGVDGESSLEKEAEGEVVSFAGGVGQGGGVGGGKLGGEVWMGGE